MFCETYVATLETLFLKEPHDEDDEEGHCESDSDYGGGLVSLFDRRGNRY